MQWENKKYSTECVNWTRAHINFSVEILSDTLSKILTNKKLPTFRTSHKLHKHFDTQRNSITESLNPDNQKWYNKVTTTSELQKISVHKNYICINYLKQKGEKNIKKQGKTRKKDERMVKGKVEKMKTREKGKRHKVVIRKKK